MRHDVRDKPFPVKVTVRSKAHESLILREARRYNMLESAIQGF